MVPSSTEGLAQKKQWWGTALPPLPAPSPLQRRGSEGGQDFGLGQKYPFVVRLHAFGFFPWPDMLTMPQPPHRSPHWGGHLQVQCLPNKRRTHQDEQGLGSGLALPAWVRAAQGPCCTVQGSWHPQARRQDAGPCPSRNPTLDVRQRRAIAWGRLRVGWGSRIWGHDLACHAWRQSNVCPALSEGSNLL